MKIRILIGANAYACIEDGPRKLDVLLSAGHSPADSLRASAAELRAWIAQYESRAACIERAAAHLEANP